MAIPSEDLIEIADAMAKEMNKKLRSKKKARKKIETQNSPWQRKKCENEKTPKRQRQKRRILSPGSCAD